MYLILCLDKIMATKHFFKTLFIFLGMILAGLLGVFLVNYFDKNQQSNVPEGEPDCKTAELC